MQALSRDRHGDHGGGVTPRRQLMAALFALPPVRQRNPRANEIAIPLFTVASPGAFVVIKNSQRLRSGFCPNK